jgi:hypothetical protein
MYEMHETDEPSRPVAEVDGHRFRPCSSRVRHRFRSTSCAIGCDGKSKDADIVPCRVVIQQARSTWIALDRVIDQDGVILSRPGRPLQTTAAASSHRQGWRFGCASQGRQKEVGQRFAPPGPLVNLVATLFADLNGHRPRERLTGPRWPVQARISAASSKRQRVRACSAACRTGARPEPPRRPAGGTIRPCRRGRSNGPWPERGSTGILHGQRQATRGR